MTGFEQQPLVLEATTVPLQPLAWTRALYLPRLTNKDHEGK